MRWVLYATVVLIGFPLLMLLPVLGMLTSVWAPFWFSGQVGTLAGQPVGVVTLPPQISPPGVIGPGLFSDADRYRLSLSVGFSPSEAIIATAISIAENGRGDPALPSAANRDGSIDLGLWQINSSHWAEFGGAAALMVPMNNARAARVLYLRGGWNQWCTYPGGCGGLPGARNWPECLARAQAAAHVAPLPGEA